MDKKFYNVVVNSERATNVGSNRGSLNYYIDWASFLKENGPYLMKCSFTSSSQILQGNYTYTMTMSGLSTNNYEVGLNGNPSSQIIASLKYGSNLGSQTYSYLSLNTQDNPPLYLMSRPNNNAFTIEIRNTINNALFYDDAIAGAGTATLSGTTLTIATQTAGIIVIGTVVTISAVAYTITGYISGTGGLGTYTVDVSGTIGTATAYTTTARNQLGPYVLNLSFEKV